MKSIFLSNKIARSLNILTYITRNVYLRLLSWLCCMTTRKRISLCGKILPQMVSSCLQSLTNHIGAENCRAEIDQSNKDYAKRSIRISARFLLSFYICISFDPNLTKNVGITKKLFYVKIPFD